MIGEGGALDKTHQLGGDDGSALGVDWDLDVSRLDALTGGHCVRALFPQLLKRHGLLHELNLHEGRLHRFLAEAEREAGTCTPLTCVLDKLSC